MCVQELAFSALLNLRHMSSVSIASQKIHVSSKDSCFLSVKRSFSFIFEVEGSSSVSSLASQCLNPFPICLFLVNFASSEVSV